MKQLWRTYVSHSSYMLHIIVFIVVLIIPFDIDVDLIKNILIFQAHISTAGDKEKLTLTPLCSPDPAQYRVWRVQNDNDFDVHFIWGTDETGQSGDGVVAANGDTTFTTIAVDGPNTTRIFIDGEEHDVKTGQPDSCDTPEPPVNVPPDTPVPSPERTVRICHCLPDPPYEQVEIDVPESEVQDYLARGDSLGPCPPVTSEPEPTHEPTETEHPTATETETPTETHIPTETDTPTDIPTETHTPTETITHTPTETETPTATTTQTPPTQTSTVTATNTATVTSTVTATATQTPPTQTSTVTATNTATVTSTVTATATATGTPTLTATPGGCDFSVAAGNVYNAGGLIFAINQANLDSDLDVICLAAGAYVMNSVQMLETGLPLITTQIEIQGNGAALLRQAGSPEFRIFRVVAGGQLILDTLSITGGSLSSADGGAIYNAGTLAIVDSLLIDNVARNGGAIYNDNGAVAITGSDILSNSAPSASGGGILNAGLNSVLILTDSNLSQNNAISGGGLFNSNGAVTITGSTINDNAATSAAGVFNDDFGVVEITNSVLSGNTSLAFGGAVAVEGTSLRINNSCITNNVSPLGSGIVNLNTTTGTAPVNAEQDWWGAANGPSGDGGGSGDSVSGNVDFIPFLTAPLPICPAAANSVQTVSRTLIGL